MRNVFKRYNPFKGVTKEDESPYTVQLYYHGKRVPSHRPKDVTGRQWKKMRQANKTKLTGPRGGRYHGQSVLSNEA